MRKSVELDLADLGEIFGDLVKKLDKMNMAEKVDLAARLKPVAKHCEAIDKAVKDEIKDLLDHEEGSVAGEVFKAVLKIIPVDRLNQSALKEGSPTVYAKYVRHDEDERINYEVK